MLRILLLLFAAGFAWSAALAGDPPQPPSKEDMLRRLQGRWKLVWSEENGQRKEENLSDAHTLAIKDDRWLIGKLEFGVITLDTSTDPMLLDLKMSRDTYEGEKGQTVEGIFKLDGDTLTVCLSRTRGQAAKARPSGFSTDANSRVTVYHFKRVKD